MMQSSEVVVNKFEFAAIKIIVQIPTCKNMYFNTRCVLQQIIGPIFRLRQVAVEEVEDF